MFVVGIEDLNINIWLALPKIKKLFVPKKVLFTTFTKMLLLFKKCHRLSKKILFFNFSFYLDCEEKCLNGLVEERSFLFKTFFQQKM